MKVSAENLVGANARAIGVAVDLQSSTADQRRRSASTSRTRRTPPPSAPARAFTAAGITVEAITPDGKRNDFIVWGLAAAGGKSDRERRRLGRRSRCCTFTTSASVGKGATLTSTEGVDVKATAFLGLQNLALAGGLSTSGTAVGGAVAVNLSAASTASSARCRASTTAFIDSGSGGDVTHRRRGEEDLGHVEGDARSDPAGDRPLREARLGACRRSPRSRSAAARAAARAAVTGS